jgi:hypothetical protein
MTSDSDGSPLARPHAGGEQITSVRPPWPRFAPRGLAFRLTPDRCSAPRPCGLSEARPKPQSDLSLAHLDFSVAGQPVRGHRSWSTSLASRRLSVQPGPPWPHLPVFLENPGKINGQCPLPDLSDAASAGPTCPTLPFGVLPPPAHSAQPSSPCREPAVRF